MPSKQVRNRCEFKEGRKRCQRQGSGTPYLCAQHRAALESFGVHVPRPGVGEKLGTLLDQVLAGQVPSPVDLEQMAADLVGRVIGRTVTVEEVQQVRHGNYQPLRDVAEQYRRARAQRAQGPRAPGPSPFDPEQAAKIEFAKECGRARAVLGFSKDDVLSEPVIKARHRELARKNHPDMGGSTEKMQRINWAADVLLHSLPR